MKTNISMTFSMDVAAEVGTDAAIILSNIQFWCAKNEVNNQNNHEGNYWTYNSVKAWNKLFPYLSESQIKTCLKKLEDNEFVITGNFNKSTYDRTKWYSPTERSNDDHWRKIANAKAKNRKSNSEKPKMDETENENGIERISQPIPDIKPNIKPDVKTRKDNFKEKIIPYIKNNKISKEEANKFFKHWTAINENGRKMHFEKQKTFQLSQRISTWNTNAKKWEKEKSSAQKEKGNKTSIALNDIN